jgi:xylan 1,4-beta-xylosidase
MKNIIASIVGFWSIFTICVEPSKSQTMCNPLNISYRFCLDKPSRREAADPSVVLFKDKYFLFASKSGGYWYSADLLNWNFVATTGLPIENYAPTAVVIGDSLYFLVSESKSIYRTSDATTGKWDVVTNTFPLTSTDPMLFADTNGRVYYYYGCSNTNPLRAIELDVKNNFQPIGKPVDCIMSDTSAHGWERPGDYNNGKNSPWIEGSWMNKYNGKYYLQYAGPGTEFKSYADGVYVSDNPLGPFSYAPNNPFSSKPEGFINGAGHGSTFADKYGNYWHIATMTISVKHMFERRLGLFPAGFDSEGNLYTYTGFGDYPFKIPTKKITNVTSLACDWNLLSYKKQAQASSQIDSFPAEFAFDENIRTYWSAKTGNSGEWLSVDIKTVSSLQAIQINFAENNTQVFGRENSLPHQYMVEYSIDNINWKTLLDKRNNDQDLTHPYFELDGSVEARYLKITNYRVPGGTFAISDVRVFGRNSTPKPGKISEIEMYRTNKDSRQIELKFKKQPNVIGYNIRFGQSKNKLYRNYMVYHDTTVTLRSLDAGQKYWFAIDAFGEGGITKGDTIENLILVK